MMKKIQKNPSDPTDPTDSFCCWKRKIFYPQSRKERQGTRRKNFLVGRGVGRDRRARRLERGREEFSAKAQRTPRNAKEEFFCWKSR